VLVVSLFIMVQVKLARAPRLWYARCNLTTFFGIFKKRLYLFLFIPIFFSSIFDEYSSSSQTIFRNILEEPYNLLNSLSRMNSLPSIYEETMDRDDDCRDGDLHKTDKSMRLLTIKSADAILDWIVFPLLLFVQFGTAMYCQQQLGVLNLRWTPAMGIISVFCVASVKYRKVFRSHPVQSITLLLLPEVFTNIVLATVMVADDLLTAMYTLTALTAVILVAALIGLIQVVKYERSVAAPKASDYKLLHQEENEDSDADWIC
jgi:hypothetical protein